MEKITVEVVSSEWYPVVEPGDAFGYQETITVSADLWKRYIAAFETFALVRSELAKEMDGF